MGYIARGKNIDIESERKILDNIPGSISVYRMKKDGRVLVEYVSSGFAKMLDYEEADMLMKKTEHSAMDEIPKEDWPVVMAAAKKSIEEHVPMYAIYHIYNKTGGKVLVRLDGNLVEDASLGEDDLGLFYCIITPVSEEGKQTLTDRDRYHKLLNLLGIAYYEFSSKGCFQSEKYKEYAISTTNDVNPNVNDNYLNYIHAEDKEVYRNFFNRTIVDGKANTAIFRAKMKDGSYRWTEVFSIVDTDDKGNPTRATNILRDVDKEWLDQKAKLEAALEKAEIANEAKSAFLSRVSHDMRTPLNGILGLTSLLKEQITLPSALKDLQHLEMSGHYLLELINDTLDMSKIESGKLELQPTVCDGRSVFNNVISLLQPNLRSKRQKLKINAENLPFTTLYIDAGRVEQIMMNLFSNAVKFTPVGGVIEFAMKNLSIENGVIVDEITVKDNGVGISPEFLPHIFEAFSQENSTRTNGEKGTGLGMAITKQLIELMGGSISVTSKVGKGATFTLKLPMSIATKEQVEAWKKSRSDEVSNASLEGKHILLCEDHPLNALIATRLLKSKGVKVTHAENGQIGVDLFATSHTGEFDAILMDIRMPIMDGLEAAKSIRNLERMDSRTIPIIAMSANAFDEDIKAGMEAGMDGYLSKPIDTQKLYSTLEKLMKVSTVFKRQKLLLVDDVEVNRATLKAALDDDYVILEAKDGKEALEVLDKTKGIDAVITDIQMPRMNGEELIEKIRNNPKFQHMVLIANTQFGDPEQEERLLALGADDFVYKATTAKTVKIRVRNALKKL